MCSLLIPILQGKEVPLSYCPLLPCCRRFLIMLYIFVEIPAGRLTTNCVTRELVLFNR